MIRPAGVADISALLELGRAMAAEAPSYRDDTFNAERLAQLLEALIESSYGFVRVAERDGEIVGAAIAAADQHWCVDSLVAQEFALYVSPKYRGGMIAVRLVTHMVAWAKTIGCKRLLAGASTGVADSKVIDLYRSLGFENFGMSVAFTFEGA